LYELGFKEQWKGEIQLTDQHGDENDPHDGGTAEDHPSGPELKTEREVEREAEDQDFVPVIEHQNGLPVSR